MAKNKTRSKDKSKDKGRNKERIEEGAGGKAPSGQVSQKMQAKEKARREGFYDKIKILLAIVIAGGSFWAYYNLPDLNPYLKGLLPVGGVLVASVIIFFWCASGRWLIQFVKDSTTELKKVARPDKKQTMQLTVYVIGFVALLSAYMWISDYLSNWVLYDLLFRR